MILYKHQQRIVEENKDKNIIMWEVGVGKTLAAIAWAINKKQFTLIICPKSVVDNWRKTIKEYDSLYESSFHIISKETFRRDWDKLGRVETIIIDEVHNFCKKSQMRDSLLGNKKQSGYLKKHNPKYVLGLSGTPFNGRDYEMIYNISEILGRGWGKTKFYEKFYRHPQGHELRYIKSPWAWIPKEGMQDEAASYLRLLGETLQLSECTDVPEQVFQQEYFGLTSEQKKVIEKLKITETTHIARWTKINQVCNGTLKGDGYVEDKFYDCEKFDRLIDLILENKKLLVFFKHSLEIKRVIDELKDKKKVFIIQGGVDNVSEICDEANKSDDCVVLINVAKTEGYSLGSFNLSVYYSNSFSLKDYEQSLGRCRRNDGNKEVKVYLSLIINNSIDKAVYESLMNKHNFQIDLYNP